jgi:putative tricarboxylic transport membrane protein
MVGLLGLWVGRDLNVGTAAEMSEGYFPLLMCKILIGLGALIGLIGFISPGGPLERIKWRPLGMVTIAVLLFAALLESLGVVLAIVAAVIVSNFAGEPARAKSVAALALVLSLAVLAIFVWGLGLPLRAFPRGIS